ncbi:MAG: outer membrane beta-barrel protein [Pseudomonadota bacterium]
MSKFASVSLISILASLAMTSAHAEGEGRFNAGINVIEESDINLTSLVVRYNRTLSSNAGFDLGVEGELSYGIVGDEVSVNTVDVDVDAELGGGVFATAAYPFTDKGSNVFVRLGYGYQEIEAGVGGVSVADEVDGFAYGVGANFMATENHGFRLDFLRIDGDDGEGDIFSGAYVFRH